MNHILAAAIESARDTQTQKIPRGIKACSRTKDDVTISYRSIAEAIKDTGFTAYQIQKLLASGEEDINNFYWRTIMK
jgi:hypothetical protein